MRILFICTHNRCRSILSEAITNDAHGDLIEARSAGSQPAGVVHPLSLKYLAETGVETSGLASQSWDEFEAFSPDLVITVCDSAANETCPIWFGDSVQIHWGLADPSKLEGSEEQKRQAFMDCMSIIKTRAKTLADLASQNLTNDDLKQALSTLVD